MFFLGGGVTFHRVPLEGFFLFVWHSELLVQFKMNITFGVFHCNCDCLFVNFLTHTRVFHTGHRAIMLCLKGHAQLRIAMILSNKERDSTGGGLFSHQHLTRWTKITPRVEKLCRAYFAISRISPPFLPPLPAW